MLCRIRLKKIRYQRTNPNEFNTIYDAAIIFRNSKTETILTKLSLPEKTFELPPLFLAIGIPNKMIQ